MVTISTTDNYKDKLMIDSGAQVCVCSPGYATECPTTNDEGFLPRLRTVNGGDIKVHGVTYVDYLVNPKHWVRFKYYVCDGIQTPVVSTYGLASANYRTLLDDRP